MLQIGHELNGSTLIAADDFLFWKLELVKWSSADT